MSLFNCIIHAFKNKRELSKQLRKYGLTMEQFINTQNAFTHYGINNCCDVSPSASENESTFNALEYISKLGLHPSNENMWPIIMTALNRHIKPTKITPT